MCDKRLYLATYKRMQRYLTIIRKDDIYFIISFCSNFTSEEG